MSYPFRLNGNAELSHIPGRKGAPFIGDTLNLIKDTRAFGKKMHSEYGSVFRASAFGRTNISLIGPEANELVLFDKEKIFSSKWGWDNLLGKLFPCGLMLRDFEDHRIHRKAMAGAFKTAPMQSYLKLLDSGIKLRIDEWHKLSQPMLFYPAIKQLTLDLASTSFLGEGLENQSDDIQTAFINMVWAAVSPIRKAIPFTQMRKGVIGRAKIIEIFSKEIPRRRSSKSDDIFTELCRATYDDGSLMSVEDIVDHMSFLLMAAHDTLTSSLSALVFYLAREPEWQDKLREEAQSLNLNQFEPFPYEKLHDLPLTEMAFKEAMRIFPPVPGMPRVAMKDFSFKGFDIPKYTSLSISPLLTHSLEEIWIEPEKFNPLRFSPENSHNRHKYAWVPFSGGAHMCLGLHFAYMQAKCFISRLLLTSEIKIVDKDDMDWQIVPIPRPKNKLPIILRRL